MVLADVIIISHNNSDVTLKCLESVYESDVAAGLNIMVVDNCSTDDTVRRISENFPKVKIIENEKNLGYAKAANIGVKNSDSDFVIVTNNDVVFYKNTISDFIEYLKSDKQAGVVGGQQFFPDGRKQISFGDLPGLNLVFKDLLLINFFKRRYANNSQIMKVPYLDGGCLAIKRKDFDTVGGFDEDYFFYTEETDFCYKMKKAGKSVVFNPGIKFIHLRGATSDGNMFSERNIELLASTRLLFCKKHCSVVERNLYFYLEKINLQIKRDFLFLLNFFFKRRRLVRKLEYFDNMLKYWKK